ncbi:MAG: thioredoxin [Agathobacter sp.]|nr:thioredoxin [Agathobacter sp.]
MVSNEKNLNPYRNAILIASLILVVYGFLNGGTVDVLAKAINICTECIGLG